MLENAQLSGPNDEAWHAKRTDTLVSDHNATQRACKAGFIGMLSGSDQNSEKNRMKPYDGFIALGWSNSKRSGTRESLNHHEQLPAIYLARHGETAWSLTGQHTGLTDLPLTARGEVNARRLEHRLVGMSFVRVFTSPLQRAVCTCGLAGFGSVAEVDSKLVEWNYGHYEGLRTSQIRAKHPDWQLFQHGCPGGESPQQVSERADLLLKQLRKLKGNVLLFSSGHFLRVLAARWLGLEPAAGKFFTLKTASVSALGYEHDFLRPVIEFWDDTRHVIG